MNPYAEILIRGLGAFAAVVFIVKMVGKSEVGSLTISDWVNGIVIGSIAADLVTSLDEPATYYALGLAVFLVLTVGTQWAGMVYRPLHKLLSDEPTVVVHNGKILEKNMRRMRYTVDDLTSQLRQKGAFNIADVEFAVAEPNGELSVLLKSTSSPVTLQDLNLPGKYRGIPCELVVDGVVIEQNLAQNRLDREWLLEELKKQGVQSLNEVFYASLDTDGQLYVDKKRDDLDYEQDITDQLPGQAPQ